MKSKESRKAGIFGLLFILTLLASIASAQNVFITNDSSHPVPVSGAGGGGGAATIADGADVTQGAKADAKNAATDTTAITAQSILKEISFMAQNPAALPANQSVNVAQIAGVTPDMNAGNTSANTQRVTQANDAPAIGATGSAVVARTVYLGARAATAAPTNATDGNTVGVMADKAGRLVVTEGSIRDLVSEQTTTISASTSETTIVSAGGAGVFCDISEISITTTNAAAATLTLKDSTGGTTRAVWNYPATAANPIQPLVLTYPVPMAQIVGSNNNWTLTASVNAGNFIVNVVYFKTK